jgi:predicted component of type VI protein secretion system
MHKMLAWTLLGSLTLIAGKLRSTSMRQASKSTRRLVPTSICSLTPWPIQPCKAGSSRLSVTLMLAVEINPPKKGDAAQPTRAPSHALQTHEHSCSKVFDTLSSKAQSLRNAQLTVLHSPAYQLPSY